MADVFLWKDTFNIGVPDIDEQHRLFLDYVNECYTAACKDSRNQVTSATIYDLKVYAETHFRYEEAVMAEHNYPQLESHARLHAYFESKVTELEQAHAGHGKSSVESLSLFLRDWFLRHILEHDKALAAFLQRSVRRYQKRPGA